jgi:hypothetical protein
MAALESLNYQPNYGQNMQSGGQFAQNPQLQQFQNPQLQQLMGLLGQAQGPRVVQPQGRKKGGFFKGLGEWLFGQPERHEQSPLYTPGQNYALDQLLAQGYGNADFGNIEKNARNQFYSQTVPSIAERFTSMGEGGQRSGAFQNALASGGAGLELGLGDLRSRLGMQQLGMGLGQRFENQYVPAEKGYLQNNLEQGAKAASRAAMAYATGGLG